MSRDNQLQQDVLAELVWEPSVVSAHIGVTANDGVITLTGHVDSFLQKHAAEIAVGRVKGVRAIAENIDVHLPPNMMRGDDDIAAAAIARLAWNVSIPANAIKIKVEAGWVTLSGELTWHFQKTEVEEEIRRLVGVVGISDQITLKPIVNVNNVSRSITNALIRSDFFDSDKIIVTSDGGTIRLSGSVRSMRDRHIAAETAWGAPGVTAVENEIAIT
jgi:osmotically-inducible protein OsmY